MEGIDTMKKFKRFKRNEYGVVKIIPHHSVLNSSNRRLQASLYEMFSHTKKKYPWQHRKGFYIQYEEDPDFWWIMKMWNAPMDDDDSVGETHIEYYMAMPREYIETFKIKIRNHDQWKRCTVEDVDDFQLSCLDEDTDIYKLKYTRNDMFSLRFENDQHTIPARDLMTISNELKPGESVDLLINCKPYDRIKWKKEVDYSWEVWDKGGMPYRKGLNPEMIWISALNLLKLVAHSLNEVKDDVIGGIEKSFFNPKDDGKPKKEFTPFKIPEREALMVNGGLSKRTANKRNQATFKTFIRSLIHSSEEVRRNTLSKAVETAFGDLSGDNSLRAIQVNFKPKQELNDLRNWKSRGIDYNLMSLEETGKLMQMPTRELQWEFERALDSNQKEEIQDMPTDFSDESGIYMGTTEIRGQTHKVYWPTDNPDHTFTPRAFIGSPRVGKDMDAVNYVVEANRKHGISVVIPDVIDERNGHRGMSDAIRDHIPPENIIDINLGDFDWPVYLGPGSLITDSANNRIDSNRITSYLTNFLMGDDIENHQTREHLREFSKAVNGDLIDIKLMCLSKKFRAQKLKELKELGWDTLAIESYHNQEGKQNAISGPILVRLGELLGDEFLKPIFGQRPNPDVNLAKWISEGKVILFRIPSRKLGEMAVKTMAYWISMLTFLTMISMDGKNHPGCFLILNEPHQFLTKGMVHFVKRMLLEGPKYRMSPVTIFHNPAACKELKELHEILLSSSVNWHIFKNTSLGIYEGLAEYLHPTFTPETAMRNTEKYHFIASWLNKDGKYEAPFIVKAPDLVTKRYDTLDNQNLTEEHSKKYGRPIQEVLDDIQNRQRIIYETK